MSHDRIIRLPECKRIAGVGKTYIYKMMKLGKFPQKRRICGGYPVGWLLSEVEAWRDCQATA